MTSPGPRREEPRDTSELLRAISQDRALGSALLFGHRHPQASPAFHVAIMDLWRAADEFVAVEAFREAAKSTLSEEFLLLEACFGNFRYCLIFGETYTKAVQRLAAIKHEAMRNQRLINLFGKQEGPTWTENAIVLSNGVRIEAHGWEEEIRGYKWLDARPDRAYLDDIENSTNTRDSAAVDQTWRKINTQLIPAMDKDRRKIRITGTPLADDCLLARCEKSPEWVVAKFPIVHAPGCEGAEAVRHPQAESLWPERYPLEWVRKEMRRMEEGGLLREFVQEYQLIAAQTQGKPFDVGDIVYQEHEPPSWLRRVSIWDPARTAKAGSDGYGRVVVSRMGSRVYVYDSGSEHMKPSEMIAAAFDASERNGQCETAIERNSLDDWLLEPIRAEVLRRGRPLDLMPLLAPADRSKHQFIMGLQAWFKAHDIVFIGNRQRHHRLVQEIENYPGGKRDALNALAYIQRVFGGEPVYPEFGQENITEFPEAGQQDALSVAIHATQSEVAAVLVAYSGRRMTVLADWVSSMSAVDAAKDIGVLLRAMYPSRRVTWWVPADVYDQAGRVSLVEALRGVQATVHRGGYIGQSRGCLADMLRTSVDRSRLLMVGSQCKATLNALAGGYRWPLGADGRAKGEPEKNVSATVMAALECLTHEVEHGHTADQLPAGFGSAVNAQGVPYLSALRRN